jgi:YfiH family protein
MSALSPLISPQLTGVSPNGATLQHGFFTRQGGVSQGLYASLNVGLGSDDNQAHVRQNRQLICEHLGGQRLISGHQTHSNITAYIGPDAPDMPRADALVSDQPNIVLGVLSADCVPVLLADLHAGVIGAAHAGWRGAHDNIIASVIDEMEARGATRAAITAVIGPAISQTAYEVGAEFVAHFAKTYSADQDLFRPAARADHAMFDLTGFVGRQLARAGVGAHLLDVCTYAEEARFFSFRRTTHRGEADYGRQLSAICLTQASA